MALDIDGFAVFRCIGSHPDSFAAVASELSKTARTLVIKQIRHKSTQLSTVRNIHDALGSDTFNLIADGMADAQIKSLAAKFDKHNPELANAAERRRHLLALASGSTEPSAKPERPARQVKPKKAAAPVTPPDRIEFRSAGATRKRQPPP